jgi:hypothetical protein
MDCCILLDRSDKLHEIDLEICVYTLGKIQIIKFQGLSKVRTVLPHSEGFGGISQRLKKTTDRFSHRLPALFREIHSHLLAITGPLNNYKNLALNTHVFSSLFASFIFFLAGYLAFLKYFLCYLTGFLSGLFPCIE